MGVGILADPFMGSGSTIAAAQAVGVRAVGVERHMEYFELARKAIPRLAAIKLVVSPTNPMQAREDPSQSLFLLVS